MSHKLSASSKREEKLVLELLQEEAKRREREDRRKKSPTRDIKKGEVKAYTRRSRRHMVRRMTCRCWSM
jgi:hypothetical protein